MAYLKEISLKELGSCNMVHLDFVVSVFLGIVSSPSIFVVIRDTREEKQETHVIPINSEEERAALVRGFRFFADILEKETCEK